MRTRRPWLWISVLLLGLSIVPSALADDNDTDDAPKPPAKQVSGHGIFNKIYDAVTPAPKAPAPKPADKKDAKTGVTAKVTIINASRVDRAQADATYFRRLAVCDHLREIATAKNDPALEQQAETLSEKAWQVYSKQLSECAAQSAKAAAKISASAGKPAKVAAADKGNSSASANGDVR